MMDRIVSIRFTPAERRTLGKALTHIRIAFPNIDTEPDRSEDSRIVRSLSSAAGGDALNRDQLLRAETALTCLLDACQIEMSRTYWEGKAFPVFAPTERGAGVPLVAPGTDMIGVLVEAREMQREHAADALALITEALASCPPVPEPEKYVEV